MAQLGMNVAPGQCWSEDTPSGPTAQAPVHNARAGWTTEVGLCEAAGGQVCAHLEAQREHLSGSMESAVSKVLAEPQSHPDPGSRGALAITFFSPEG